MTNYSEHISEELARKLLDCGYPLGNHPTYGEVFDWFSRVKGIVISLEPFHTFALKGQIGYTWKLSYLGDNPYKLENQIELGANGGAYGGSFKLTADEAIKFAMTLGEKKEKYIEVNIDEL